MIYFKLPEVLSRDGICQLSANTSVSDTHSRVGIYMSAIR